MTLDTFNFIQPNCPLELVFTLGLSVDSLCSEDIFISNHCSVIFNLSVTVTPSSAHYEVCSY